MVCCRLPTLTTILAEVKVEALMVLILMSVLPGVVPPSVERVSDWGLPPVKVIDPAGVTPVRVTELTRLLVALEYQSINQ